MLLALQVLASAGPNYSTILTVGATILIALFGVGSALGGYAAFRTGKTNAIAASAVARADEAEKTAQSWKERVEAIEAEFATYKDRVAHDQLQRDEALHVAEHEQAKLKEQVATLTGVVTARHEIMELTAIVAAMAKEQSAAIAKLTGDHADQAKAHQAILAAIGGRRGGDDTTT